MISHLFTIECLTNLHVGSGETNYNIIDKEVERDPIIKNTPIIPSSGVKGALLEHCRDVCIINSKTKDYIFGYSKEAPDENNNDKIIQKTEAGAYKFFTANLLARPLRVSCGDKSYVLATTQEILEQFDKLTGAVGISEYNLGKPMEKTSGIPCSDESIKGVEGIQTTCHELNPDVKKLLGYGYNDVDYCVVPSFQNFSLPVIARNQLTDGISNNLWYEEFVPYKSVFYLIILHPEADKKINPEIFDEFKNAITKTDFPVQFGANASIGCGYTQIKYICSNN